MSSERVDIDETTTGKGAPSTGSDVQRQARTAAQQREVDASKDPEVLVRQIEQTREDLAVTLDAIADKVSPKRVASRTKESVTETVKVKVAQAKEVAAEKTAQAKQVVNEKTAQAKQAVEDRRSGGTDPNASSVRLDTTSTSTSTADATSSTAAGVDTTLPPVTGVEVPPLRPATGTARSSGSLSPSSSSASGAGSPLAGVPPQALAGAGAAVVGLLLLLRRRRHKRG